MTSPFRMYWGINYKFLVSKSVYHLKTIHARRLTSVLHVPFIELSLASNIWPVQVFIVLLASFAVCKEMNLQISNKQNYILFKISASGLF